MKELQEELQKKQELLIKQESELPILTNKQDIEDCVDLIEYYKRSIQGIEKEIKEYFENCKNLIQYKKRSIQDSMEEISNIENDKNILKTILNRDNIIDIEMIYGKWVWRIESKYKDFYLNLNLETKATMGFDRNCDCDCDLDERGYCEDCEEFADMFVDSIDETIITEIESDLPMSDNLKAAIKKEYPVSDLFIDITEDSSLNEDDRTLTDHVYDREC